MSLDLRIAYIGGGSRGWARTLMLDLALCPDLGGAVRLYDIDRASAELNARLGTWIESQEPAVGRWRYEAVPNLEAALGGADFVFLSIQPGPLGMMGREIAVAERYGMYFPVGDTAGGPGLMRSLRAAIIYEGFAHAIAAACPRAWVVNYSNPMSVCTRTLTRVEPGLKVMGCCHEVFGTQALLGEMAVRSLGLDRAPARDEIHCNISGINHFTWIDSATYRGHDLLGLLRQYVEEPGVVRPFSRDDVEARRDYFQDNRQIKLELFRRYGALPAAGDRHLCEFVPGFISSPEELFRWGVIRTPVSYRIERWAAETQRALDILAGRVPLAMKSSQEEAVRQMRALCGLGDLVTNVNTENVGQAADLPRHAVVETNAYLGSDVLRPLVAGALPAGVQALVARHVGNQELILEAALQRNVDLAFQAILNDPNTHLPIDTAWRMFGEIGLPEGFW
jgi:galacturan 1,4-alpha-galacturonidase